METILRHPERYKRVISRFYTGRATVKQIESVADERGRSRFEESVLYEDIPCRLSHESKNTTANYERNITPQTIELFTDNVYEIPSGCRITVTQDNVTRNYSNAAEPNVYETHQEIELTILEDYS